MKQRSQHFWVTNGFSLLYLATISPCQAQIPEVKIVSDATLTPDNSLVTPKLSNTLIEITGGIEAGRNLFHSFGKFDISEKQTADFVSPNANIQNILARVTGGSPSQIMGTLSTSGLSNSNLFLINPNGIVFGPKAQVNVGGSFVATTANAIDFGGEGFFSASAPNAPGLLTVNPSAFLFNQIAAQPINSIEIGNGAVLSAGSQVKPGSLLLVGGNVLIDGGELKVPGGRVELAGLAGAETVRLNVNGNNLSLSFPDSVARADISLFNQATVDVNADSGGSVAINAQNVSLKSSSISSNTEQGDGGGIYIQTGVLSLTDGAQLQSDTIGKGHAGKVEINARDTVSFDGLSFISSDTYGSGDAGEVFVQANNFVYLAERSSISSLSEGNKGNGGNIHIYTGMLSLDDANLNASNNGPDNGGNINIYTGVLSLKKGTVSASNNGSGNGGSINIQAVSLSLTNGSRLGSGTTEEAQPTKVIIDAQDTVSLDNSFILSSTFGKEDSGIINIAKPRVLSLKNGAALVVSTFGEGKAGTIEINTSDSVSVSGVAPGGYSSGIFTTTEARATGGGGGISVTTGALRVSDGGVLSSRNASTSSSSFGGNISVDAKTVELTNGGQILASAFQDSSGRAGNITVNSTDSVTISGSDPTFTERFDRFNQQIVDSDDSASGLFVRSLGLAEAGNIQVTTRSIRLDNQGTLTAETALGEGGKITLETRDILLRHNSNITATAGTEEGPGNGGDIKINTDLFTALENSKITADAFDGKGGNIRIRTQGFFLSPDSKITASSERGIDGVVEINTLNNDPRRGLVNLPSGVVDVSGLIAQGCTGIEGNVGKKGEFIVAGRGGLPDNPSDTLSSDAVEVDLVTLNPREENRSSPTVSTNPTSLTPAVLVEAQGWVIGKNGEVILTATAPTVTPYSPGLKTAECHMP